MGGGELVTGRRIENGDDLGQALIELAERHPEAAVMLRELIDTVLTVERAEPGAGLAIIREYRDRWGGDQALDAGQIAEVRAWLASR